MPATSPCTHCRTVTRPLLASAASCALRSAGREGGVGERREAMEDLRVW